MIQMSKEVLVIAPHMDDEVLGMGCGKGRFTNRLKSATCGLVTALDILPTAVWIAKSRYPDIEFLTSSVSPLHFQDGGFDLVVCAELFWYVLPNLSVIFAEVKRVLEPGGHYLIIQQFYKPKEQKYGNEIMQTPEDLIRILPFRFVYQVEVDRLSNHKLVALCQKPE